MKRLNSTISTCFSAILLLFVGHALHGAPARGIVREKLTEQGIKVGYASSSGRHVAIGVAEAKFSSVENAGAFAMQRERLYKLALFRAKQEILFSVKTSMEAKDALDDNFRADGSARSSFLSMVKMLSEGLYCGFLPIASAESFENGRYQVAIAVGWSEKSEMKARRMLSGKIDIPEGGVFDGSEWTKWAEDKDFSFIVGAWLFLDSAGFIRYAGVGFADVEGKKGATLAAARIKAKSKATQALAYALYGDIEASTQATQVAIREEDSEGKASEAVEEDFLNRIQMSLKNKVFRGNEVYTTTVVHPISGHKIFISIVGIEPDNLSEMNLLTDLP